MRFQGFIGPSYTLQSVNIDCQRCINMYPETDESGRGKEGEVMSLVTRPGLSSVVTIANTPLRGLYAATDGLLYAVGGNTLYKISSAYAATSIGTLDTNSGTVSFADNGTTLFVVDGAYGYYHTLGSGTTTKVTDSDFKPADKVVFIDGYFVFNESGTQRFFFSDLNDVTFDALDIVSAEGNPDNIISIIADHRDLWLFGTRSTEVFFNSGSEQVFERVQGAFVEHGCAAVHSVAKMNNAVFWVGNDDQGNGIVYMAQGYQPQRVSTHAVELAIRGYEDISSAVAYTYQENGHYFYVLNFDNAETSWVFDMATGLWHERAFLNDGSLERHRGNYHAFCYGKHFLADYVNGKIYEQSTSYYLDGTDEILRRRVAPHITSGLNRVFHNAFQLDMEVGVGLDGAVTVQGNDPKVMLRYSDDGGHSWSNEKWASFGKIGQRKLRAIFRRLGYSRDRVYELTVTDPVKTTFIGAELDVMAGAS